MEDLGKKEDVLVEKETTDLVGEECEQQDELMEILLNTREQGQMMENLIKNQIEIKDEMINKLHKELDYYKQDAADRFVDQLMKAVIKVRKDMAKLMVSEKWDTMTAEQLQGEYRYIFEDLTDLLEQQNIDEYTTSPGDVFDASLHVAKVEQTDDPLLNKVIIKSLNEGYKKGEKVLLAERVLVYQYNE